MNIITKVFRGKKDEPRSPMETIRDLKNIEEMLIKKQEFLETKIEEQLNIARTNGVKNKRAALQALKKKKRLEKQLQQIDGTLSTIEMQKEALESANTNTAVIQTMKGAADALKSAHKHLNVEDVHEIMDDIAEQQEISKEISDAISNPFNFGEDIDEDELLQELDELEQEELDKELLDITPPQPTAVNMPSVPVAEPTKAKVKIPEKIQLPQLEDDEDLKELAGWAT